ncbi:hypothetical protein lbkm_0268 [Lachnospiraceae bacterium KM106-2]|nr:hypothetical protein lbkm_0268 [Lachnospiraceae bacterium KM106-2]
MVESKNDTYIKKILNDLKLMDYIKPGEIPNIDLYMDQVTTFMDEHLYTCKRFEDDKMLTKTMINNYTKNNLLPSPNKKKYSKEHMLLLVFIYYFKNILSISDIQSILNPLTEKYFNSDNVVQLEDIYSEVFGLEEAQMENLTKDVLKKYMKSLKTFDQVEDEEEKEFLNKFSLICMLSYDVYVKKALIEKIIDRELVPLNEKLKEESNPKKKDKDNK